MRKRKEDEVQAVLDATAENPCPTCGTNTPATNRDGTTWLCKNGHSWPVSHPPEEDKSQRFIRLAQFRITRAINYISTIENLANSGNYDYTEDQVAELIKALDNAVGKLETAFSQSDDRKNQAVFKFEGD